MRPGNFGLGNGLLPYCTESLIQHPPPPTPTPHTPCAAYMRQETGSALVQVMAWRLSAAKPLPEPMLNYSQWDPEEYTAMKFEAKYIIFHLKILTEKWRPFCLAGDELTNVEAVNEPRFR